MAISIVPLKFLSILRNGFQNILSSFKFILANLMVLATCASGGGILIEPPITLCYENKTIHTAGSFLHLQCGEDVLSGNNTDV